MSRRIRRMRAIYKYQLEVKDEQRVRMHSKAQLLHVAVQHGKVCLWTLVNLDLPLTDRQIFISGTGHPIQAPYGTKYVGTFMLLEGNFVGHVFG
jgi:hypothetical protein